MAQSAMGLKLWVFGFADHTRKNKCAHNLRAPCGILRVYLYTRTAVDAGDKPRVF